MNQFKSAKIAYVVFALVIFSLVANIVYLGVTGKHLLKVEVRQKRLIMQPEGKFILVIMKL